MWEFSPFIDLGQYPVSKWHEFIWRGIIPVLAALNLIRWGLNFLIKTEKSCINVWLVNKNVLLLHSQFGGSLWREVRLNLRHCNGQLAQLVQSISLTRRGSGVRIPHCPHYDGSLAQLNRAFDYGSKGCRFESCRSHYPQSLDGCGFFSPEKKGR